MSGKDSHIGRAWLAGAAGLSAVGTIAAVSVARQMTRRDTGEDPYAGEDFEALDGDRSYVVTTPDGVPLAVREVGPEDAPLAVVFAHGFCLRMGAFYFQQPRHLVVGLAGGVVDRAAQFDDRLAERTQMQQVRVSA